MVRETTLLGELHAGFERGTRRCSRFGRREQGPFFVGEAVFLQVAFGFAGHDWVDFSTSLVFYWLAFSAYQPLFGVVFQELS